MWLEINTGNDDINPIVNLDKIVSLKVERIGGESYQMVSIRFVDQVEPMEFSVAGSRGPDIHKTISRLLHSKKI